MKTTINVSVEKELLHVAEQYAEQHQISLAQLIESFFQGLNKPKPYKNIIQLVSELQAPIMQQDKDLKQAYYEEQKDKYGF